TSPLLLEEPIRLASILEHSHYHRSVPCLTKIVGTVGGNSKTVEQLSALLEAGMTAARFDFSVSDQENHQETYENLREAMKKTHRMCATVYDTHGPEITIANTNNATVTMTAGSTVVLSGDKDHPVTAQALPLACPQLAKAVKPGDEVFVGRYLFTGSETTSVWLKVEEVKGEDIVCTVTNTAELQGDFFTVHAAQVDTDMPILSKVDERHLSTWGVNCLPHIIFLSFTRNAEDVRYARNHLAQLGKLSQSFIFAKIESIQGLRKIDEILAEADGLVLGRGDLGIDLPAEKVFLMQKVAIYKANMAGKPCVISRVVDTMTDTPRPTRAEATDVANAVLDAVHACAHSDPSTPLSSPFPPLSLPPLPLSPSLPSPPSPLFPYSPFPPTPTHHTRPSLPFSHCSLFHVNLVAKCKPFPSASHASPLPFPPLIPLPLPPLFLLSSPLLPRLVAKLVAKYKPTMPVLTLVNPPLSSPLSPSLSSPSPLSIPPPSSLFLPQARGQVQRFSAASGAVLHLAQCCIWRSAASGAVLHHVQCGITCSAAHSAATGLAECARCCSDAVDNTGPLLGRVGQLQQQLHHQLLPSSQASTHPLPSNPHGPNQAAVRSERSDQVPLSEGSNQQRIDSADWEDQALGRLASGGLGGGGGGRRSGVEEERSAAGMVDHGGIVPEGVVPDALDRRIPMLIRMSPERLQLPLEALPHAVDSSEQKNVMLAYRERFDKFGDLIRCHGPPCPDFASCGSAFPNVHACWNPLLDAPLLLPARAPLNCPKKVNLKRPRVAWQNHDKTCSHPRDFNPREPSAMQVFRLHDVMVTHKGFVFNATHRYVHQGCKRFNPFSYPQGQKVHRIKLAFDWGYTQGNNFYHFLVEAIPSFFVAAAALPNFRDIPIIAERFQ
ncbi:unnamed protein product, partial [Closterium sp. NIES-54]